MSNSDSDVGCAALRCVCLPVFLLRFVFTAAIDLTVCVCVCVWADSGGVAVLAMCINNSKSFMQISVKEVGWRKMRGRGGLTVIAARCKSSSQEQCLCVFVYFFVFSFLPFFLIIVLFGVFRLPLRCMRQHN